MVESRTRLDGNKIVVEENNITYRILVTQYRTMDWLDNKAYTHGHNGSPVGDLLPISDAYATWEAPINR